jgi:hypothetical protein
MWYNLRETWLDLPEPRQPFLEIGLQNMNIFYAGHHATEVFGVKANSGFLGRSSLPYRFMKQLHK